MSVIIRPAQPADAPALIAILNPIILAGIYTAMSYPLTLAQQLEYMRQFPLRGVFLVAARPEDGKIVGLQSVEPLPAASDAFQHVGEISTFVGLEERRGGIGRALSQVTFHLARSNGFLKLMANVRADNPAALAFYQQQGFAVIGTAHRHALIAGRFIDEIFLEKFLP